MRTTTSYENDLWNGYLDNNYLLLGILFLFHPPTLYINILIYTYIYIQDDRFNKHVHNEPINIFKRIAYLRNDLLNRTYVKTKNNKSYNNITVYWNRIYYFRTTYINTIILFNTTTRVIVRKRSYLIIIPNSIILFVIQCPSDRQFSRDYYFLNYPIGPFFGVQTTRFRD